MRPHSRPGVYGNPFTDSGGRGSMFSLGVCHCRNREGLRIVCLRRTDAAALQYSQNVTARERLKLLSLGTSMLSCCWYVGRPTCMPETGVRGLHDNLFIDTQIDRLLRRDNNANQRENSMYNLPVYDRDPFTLRASFRVSQGTPRC